MEYVYNPEEAFATTLGTFTLFGLWPSAVKHPLLSIAYKIYGFIYQSLYIIALLPTQLINVYFMRGNLQKLVESSFFTLTCAGYSTKLFLFLLRRKKIEEFFERLHHPIFVPRRKEHLMIMKNAADSANENSIVYLALCLFTCVWWIMYPFVDNKGKELLFAAWYPFDTSQNPVYGYTYAFQTLFLLTTASMASMMDMLVTNFYVLMVGQIEVLKQNFQLLADNDFGNNNKKLPSVHGGETNLVSTLTILQRHRHVQTTSPSKNNISETKFLREILHDRIIRYTIHYEEICNLVKDVTQLFQIGIVVQICASSIIICVTCFELTSLSPSKLQFYVILQYQMCMLIQIFIYTWRGNDVIIKTSELKNAVYDCAWTSVPDTKFRKELCIVMTRLQKSVKLQVGNIFLLSVDTFFHILRSAYSLFILLKQAQE